MSNEDLPEAELETATEAIMPEVIADSEAAVERADQTELIGEQALEGALGIESPDQPESDKLPIPDRFKEAAAEFMASDEGAVSLDMLLPGWIIDKVRGRTTEESMNPDGTSALITRDKQGREVARVDRDYQGRRTGIVETSYGSNGNYSKTYSSPDRVIQKEETSGSWEGSQGRVGYFTVKEYDPNNPLSYTTTHRKSEDGPVDFVEEVRVEGVTYSKTKLDSDGRVEEKEEVTYRTTDRKSAERRKSVRRPSLDSLTLEVSVSDYDLQDRPIKTVRTLESGVSSPEKVYESSIEYFDDGTEVETSIRGSSGEKRVEVRTSEVVKVNDEWIKRDIQMQHDKDGTLTRCEEVVTVFEKFKDYAGRKGFRPIRSYTAVDFSELNGTETREGTTRVTRFEYESPDDDFGRARYHDPESPEVRTMHKPLSEVKFESPDSLRRKLGSWLDQARNPRQTVL